MSDSYRAQAPSIFASVFSLIASDTIQEEMPIIAATAPRRKQSSREGDSIGKSSRLVVVIYEYEFIRTETT